jgi:hypothetical protein
MLKKLLTLALVTVASPALAQGLPLTQDEWYVDSGRYLNGDVPSYNQDHTYRQIVDYAATHQLIAYKETRHAARLIEGRSSAGTGTIYDVPEDYLSTGREQMVSATGA